MTIALGTSAAHPLYLYIVFAVCVVGALALLISGWISSRRSSHHHWNTQTIQRPAAKPEPVYPADATPVTLAVPEATASVPAKTTTPRKASTRPGAKKTTAKKTTAKKTAAPETAE